MQDDIATPAETATATAEAEARLDRAFAALSDPTRRAILRMLLEDDMAVTDVAEPFAISLAAISKHLAILARAGLISQEVRGRVKWCKLEPDALREVAAWVEGFGLFSAFDLDRIEGRIEAALAEAGTLAGGEAAEPAGPVDEGDAPEGG